MERGRGRARKGLADTALKTADAGYLTRRLVDVSQDVIVREEDCGTNEGFNMSADKEGEKVIVSLRLKISGRYLQQDIKDPNTDEVIYIRNTLITDEMAAQIETLGYETVKVRSILTCESVSGVCGCCYGIDLATLQPVEKGEAVGIRARGGYTVDIAWDGAEYQAEITASFRGTLILSDGRSFPHEAGQVLHITAE